MENTLLFLLQNAQKAFNKKDYNLSMANLYKASKITKNPKSIKTLMTKLQLKIKITGQNPPTLSLTKLQAPWTIMPSFLILFIFFFIFKTLLSIYKKKKLSFKYIFSFILFFSFCFYTAIKQYNFYIKPQALNIKNNVNFYLSPDKSSPILFSLKQMHLLKIIKLKNNWALAQDQGQVGWINRDVLFFTNFSSLDILLKL